MSWLEILGAVGGSAGIVALVKAGIDLFMAKSSKTKVDVSNMQEMLDEAHKMYDEATTRYNNLAKRFDEYKDRCDKKIDDVLCKFNILERTVTQAYRCKYPENIQDCPVVKSYEAKHCDACAKES